MKDFKDLSVKRQKMRIVKDAIAQINAGTFKAREGFYLRFDDSSPVYDGKKLSLQKVLQNDSVCECCAKGALFAACVINVNKVSNRDDFESEFFQKQKLKKWFSEAELDLIETAFEGAVVEDSMNVLRQGSFFDYKETALAKKAIRFHKRYKNPQKRLLAILENILIYKEFTL